MASCTWYSGSYPGGLGANERAGPCSKPWSTGRMTSLPVPARVPWLSRRARLVTTPGLSDEYQDRICRTRSVTLMVDLGSSWGADYTLGAAGGDQPPRTRAR